MFTNLIYCVLPTPAREKFVLGTLQMRFNVCHNTLRTVIIYDTAAQLIASNVDFISFDIPVSIKYTESVRISYYSFNNFLLAKNFLARLFGTLSFRNNSMWPVI